MPEMESTGIHAYTHILFKDVPLVVEFMYIVFTPTPGDICHR